MLFSKYEATGNDFVMVDCTREQPALDAVRVRELCDRHRGVGADGVILLLPSTVADVRMRVLNADGSEAQMCGNGVRALFLFARRLGVTDADTLTVETVAGIREVRFTGGEGASGNFTVDMGEPAWTRGSVPMQGEPAEAATGVSLTLPDGAALTATCVSMGNPHCVVFVEDVASYPVERVGPLVEHHELFPQQTNTEFVQVLDEDRLAVRVWERGVGETQACGTGACAALVAASLVGQTGKRADVSLPGGVLQIVWDGAVFMTGPARHVFDGKTLE